MRHSQGPPQQKKKRERDDGQWRVRGGEGGKKGVLNITQRIKSDGGEGGGVLVKAVGLFQCVSDKKNNGRLEAFITCFWVLNEVQAKN